MNKVYAAIDLKSFYSSVECCERGLDPLTTNLVVADEARTEKTICLAVSPALRKYGLGGRARLFEVLERIKFINAERLQNAPHHRLVGKSANSKVLDKHPEYALDLIIAKPRMNYYLKYSQKIYQIYLNHVAPDDMFAYSIDEVFCDITSYLKMAKMTSVEFVRAMIDDVYEETGVTATAGVGTNLFLAKVAMDIIAKHMEADARGVRIAELDEHSYRQKLWEHEPITDFWRIGPGTARRLQNRQMYTMGDVARCSLINEDLLYDLFGINAELVIDHAWGIEPTTIKMVKQYQPTIRSLSSSQVLPRPYDRQQAEVIIKEMAENLALELERKHYFTDRLVLRIGYERAMPGSEDSDETYRIDRYGRIVLKPSRGTWRLPSPSASTEVIVQGFRELFQRIVNHKHMIRRVCLATGNLTRVKNHYTPLLQTDIFHDYQKLSQEKKIMKPAPDEKAEHELQKAVLKIRARYGNNAILRGTNFEDGATGRQRNLQIGGHKA